MRWIRVIERALLALIVCVAMSGQVFAQTTGCDALEAATAEAPAEMTDVISCAFESVNIYSVIVSLMGLVIPAALVIWGLRGGLQVVWGLLKRGFSALSRTG